MNLEISYRFEITDHRRDPSFDEPTKKATPWMLFCRYLPNPLASGWKFFATENEAKRHRDLLAKDLEKEGVRFEII